jgi:Ca2+-binding RTX toxin-like protein
MPTFLRITIVLAVLLLAPQAAHATTTVSLSNDGQTLTLSGDGTASTVDVFVDVSDATYLEVASYFDIGHPQSSADYLQAGSNCLENDPPGGSRPTVRCGPTSTTLRRVTGTLGAGDDYVQLLAPFPGGVTLDGGDDNDYIDSYAGSGSVTQVATLTGGAGADDLVGDGGTDTLDGGTGVDSLTGNGGADELTGGEDGDSLHGGAGADTLTAGGGADLLTGGSESDELDAGDGADSLLGGAGDDSLDGGTGNDSFEDGAGAPAGKDDIVGGSGEDSVTYESEAYPLTAITLDDAANDGDANPATGASVEQDNVHSDVEHVTTANDGASTTVVGSGVRNEINAFGRGNTVTGGAGDDYINATCYPQCSFGQGGDTIDGGAGNDLIHTSTGADEIVGGSGQDEIYADNCSSFTCSQPDDIDVADGERDTVYCGGGGDTVRADSVDELVMCTNVTIVDEEEEEKPTEQPTQKPTGQPTTNPPATTPAATTPPATTAARCKVPKLRKLSLAKARKRIKAAGCRVGKVRKPRGVKASRLVVTKQSRRAGSRVPRSTKVNLTLARRR